MGTRVPACLLPGWTHGHTLSPACPPNLALWTPHARPQVFSLAYGTVHAEVNSLKRGSGKSRHKQEHNLVARVSEEGVTFCSYRWGDARRD